MRMNAIKNEVKFLEHKMDVMSYYFRINFIRTKHVFLKDIKYIEFIKSSKLFVVI